jgi:carbamoyl-phosphate synthase small subunit
VSRAPRTARLLLQDGTHFTGISFGAEAVSVGEVVFNTGMVGYLESMTDPSYAGQILCFSYPLIGNYGVPSREALDKHGLPLFMESDSIKVRGLAVQEACAFPSHWSSARTLHNWMEAEGVPGIASIDTRALVTRLREFGVMMGVLSTTDQEYSELQTLLSKAESYDSLRLVEEVSAKSPLKYGSGERAIVLLDCGAKLGIVRNLLDRGYSVVRLPYNASYSKVMSYDPVGVVVSNGPGDPSLCKETVKSTTRLIEGEIPLLGICLGEQIVGISQGATTYKLKYGHRGQNKPCVDVDTGRGYVTSQNHGYSLEHRSLKETELRTWFINSDDLSIEGVQHRSKPCIAVQFHPEASPGPYDTGFVFDRFDTLVQECMGKVKGEAIRSVKR